MVASGQISISHEIEETKEQGNVFGVLLTKVVGKEGAFVPEPSRYEVVD